MFASNPFAELSASISPSVMQTYIIIMALLVIGGTLLDVLHKKSATYFFEAGRKARRQGSQQVDSGDVRSATLKAVAEDVLASGEFCNQNRRIAHLLTMYGFVTFVLSTVVMVFWYPTAVNDTPGLWTFLWTLGALMVCIGGYWFWFFIRVDVAAEGNSPFRIVRADLFVLSLLACTTFALIWAFLQSNGSSWTSVFLGLFLIATTVLFGSVPWSKFSHMFFKPAAAVQKRVNEVHGSRRNLPKPADEPEIYGTARRLPRNY